jgi:hypothetical protein
LAAFTEVDWRRIDFSAIVTFGGIITISEQRHQEVREWLLRQSYVISTFDCQPGLAAAIPELGSLLSWEAQFGYKLGPEGRNLDALRDGFKFPIPEGGGHVFEVVRPDLAWAEDQHWLCGLLAIACEYTRLTLVLGRRFFTILIVPAQSPFIGTVVENVAVPGLYSHPLPQLNKSD